MPDAKEVLEWYKSQENTINRHREHNKAVYKLLKLEGRGIEVFNCCGDIGLMYEHSEVKDPPFLVGAYGRGSTVEEAAEDYYNKISGKTLVFHSGTEKREEVTIL